MEEVIQVTADDEFVRWVSRKEVHDKKLIHRSVHAFVRHPDGRILVQLRHRDKQTYPHHWDISCSGHVDRIDHPNDDPSQAQAACDLAIERELLEELGVDAPAKLLCEIPPIAGVNYEYSRLYIAEWSKEFILQETEVEEVQWIRLEDISSLQPITKSLRWMVENASRWNV